MSNPQQPELARSRKTPAQDQDAVAAVIDGQSVPGADEPRGPVPPDNQAGHHPVEEQDKPDLNAFAQKLGTMEPSDRSDTPEGRDATLRAYGRRRMQAGVAAVVATLAAVVLAVVTVRRRRSRRSR